MRVYEAMALPGCGTPSSVRFRAYLQKYVQDVFLAVDWRKNCPDPIRATCRY